MLDWLLPSSTTTLRGFIGLTGFYRKFIKGYAQVANPLTTLLCKDQFLWNPGAQQAFELLKHLMTTSPVLAIPDFTFPFVLESDMST